MLLRPEDSIRHQNNIGSDIMMQVWLFIHTHHLSFAFIFAKEENACVCVRECLTLPLTVLCFSAASCNLLPSTIQLDDVVSSVTVDDDRFEEACHRTLRW